MRSFIALLLCILPLVSCFGCIPNVTQELISNDCTSFTFQVTIMNVANASLNEMSLVPCSDIVVTSEELVMNCDSSYSFTQCFTGIPALSAYKFNYTHDKADPANLLVTANCTQAAIPATRASAMPAGNATPTSSRPRPTRPATKPTTKPTTAPTTKPTSQPSAPTTKPTSAPANSTISGKCSGNPRMLNGKPCASTTRYWDANEGACGCGGTSGAFGWIGSTYTAAASPSLFGSATWCGNGCGKCYKLTATGYSPEGTGASAGASITVMVTNLCPSGGQWCAAGTNSFQYGAHFDLADAPTGGLISKLGWDNPEVVYEEVPCSGASLTASNQQYNQCICSAM